MDDLLRVFLPYLRLFTLYRVCGDELRSELNNFAAKIRRAEVMEARLVKAARTKERRNNGADLRISRMSGDDLRSWYVSLIRKVSRSNAEEMKAIRKARGYAEAIKFGETVLRAQKMNQPEDNILEAKLLLLRARRQGRRAWEEALDHLERYLGIPALRAERLWQDTQGARRLPFIKKILAKMPPDRAELMLKDFAHLYGMDADILARELFSALGA